MSLVHCFLCVLHARGDNPAGYSVFLGKSAPSKEPLLFGGLGVLLVKYAFMQKII